MVAEEDLAEYKIMFNTKGWKILMESLSNDLTNIEKDTLYRVNDIETLYANKGRAETLKNIINLQNAFKAIEAHQDLEKKMEFEYDL